LLEAAILAPRLSGSKVQSLTASALSLADSGFDTELVTSLYKLNSALLAGSTSRISSLYVFDAIARGARGAATKGKGKAGAAGGAGGLVNKMEGVVDSWVKGMMDDAKGDAWAEGRVSSRAILTFSVPVRKSMRRG
jgi:protein NRD1